MAIPSNFYQVQFIWTLIMGTQKWIGWYALPPPVWSSLVQTLINHSLYSSHFLWWINCMSSWFLIAQMHHQPYNSKNISTFLMLFSYLGDLRSWSILPYKVGMHINLYIALSINVMVQCYAYENWSHFDPSPSLLFMMSTSFILLYALSLIRQCIQYQTILWHTSFLVFLNSNDMVLM